MPEIKFTKTVHQIFGLLFANCERGEALNGLNVQIESYFSDRFKYKRELMSFFFNRLSKTIRFHSFHWLIWSSIIELEMNVQNTNRGLGNLKIETQKEAKKIYLHSIQFKLKKTGPECRSCTHISSQRPSLYTEYALPLRNK